MVAGNVLADVEPQYGVTYLPRKFKIVITVPPYNDVDVYAHDVGLIAIVEDNEVVGFNVLAGGGMGSTHNNKRHILELGLCWVMYPKTKFTLLVKRSCWCRETLVIEQIESMLD